MGRQNSLPNYEGTRTVLQGMTNNVSFPFSVGGTTNSIYFYVLRLLFSSAVENGPFKQVRRVE